MNNGWVKIHRQLLDWEWYKDLPVYKLFTHLLLKANHKPAKWQGHEILRGQLITGRKQLAIETGLSEQQIRTSISKLKSTSAITIVSTSKFSLISIVNYNTYQSEDEYINQQDNHQPTSNPTNEQPAINQQSTTNKNDKNDKNDKEVKNNPPTPLKGGRIKKPKIKSCSDIPEYKDVDTDYSKPLDEWLSYKADRNEAYQIEGVRKIVKQYPTTAALQAAVDQSIANGWKGLFPVKNGSTKLSGYEVRRQEYIDLVSAPIDDLMFE